jgi:hypothetical protein
MSTETKFERRVTQTTVVPVGEAIFSEWAVSVSICDESAGEFIVVGQQEGSLRIDPHEWPAIRDAIDEMVGMCRDAKPSVGKDDHE